MRQAHYAASDELHAAQGALAEAALEVSRLEERIRYVVEGRQRVEQRLVELQGAERDLGWTAAAQAQEELETIAAQIAGADEQSEVLAAQAEEQARQPARRRGCGARRAEPQQRAAHGRRGRAAADPGARGRQPQHRGPGPAVPAAPREARRGTPPARRARPRPAWTSSRRSSRSPPMEASAVADERLHELTEAGARARRRPPREAGRRSNRRHRPPVRPRAPASTRCARCRRRCRPKASSSPGSPSTASRTCRACGRRCTSTTGWETALESALREKLSALEVGRLETVRAFASDAPPAKLAFYSLPQGAIVQHPPDAAARCRDLLQLERCRPEGAAQRLARGRLHRRQHRRGAWPRATKLTHGETDHDPRGACRGPVLGARSTRPTRTGRHARPRAGDREPRARTARPDPDRRRRARRPACAPRRPTPMRPSAWPPARREAGETQTKAHQMQVELLRLSQQAEQTSTRRGQLDEELAEIDAQLEELNERRATGEARFEELDMQLATTQERHAELDEARDRRRTHAWPRRASSCASLERRAQEAQFALAGAGRPPRRTAARPRDVAPSRCRATRRPRRQLREELRRLDRRLRPGGPGGGAGACSWTASRPSAPSAANYDDLTPAPRKRIDEQRLSHRAERCEPLRDRITKLQLEEQAAAAGRRRSSWNSSRRPQNVDLAALEQNINDERRQALRPAGRDRPHQPRDQRRSAR